MKAKPELRLDHKGYERRLFTFDRAEVRAASDEDDLTADFVGHAAVFNKPTIIRGWFDEWEEEIRDGAFKKTIKEADVRFLVNHDPNLLLARNKAGTLSLSEDSTGLLTEAPNLDRRQSYTNDAVIALERGDLDQMSFAFEVVKEEWDFDADPVKRTITEVRLWDVSVVTYPAYTETDASLRSAGFDALCASMNLDDEARKQLLKQLATGEVNDSFAPMLRAAGEALVTKARSFEPDFHSEDAQRKLRFLAHQYDLSLD
jgi:uncharacterized protein